MCADAVESSHLLLWSLYHEIHAFKSEKSRKSTIEPVPADDIASESFNKTRSEKKSFTVSNQRTEILTFTIAFHSIKCVIRINSIQGQ